MQRLLRIVEYNFFQFVYAFYSGIYFDSMFIYIYICIFIIFLGTMFM